MVAQEDVMLLVSRDGYVKRSSLRSFKASDESDNGLKEEDVVILMKVANTLDHLLMFTNKETSFIDRFMTSLIRAGRIPASI